MTEYASATCRCHRCGRCFKVLADEYGDHPCPRCKFKPGDVVNRDEEEEECPTERV